MKVIVIAGTRPEAIKVAPVVREFKKHPEVETLLCNSGQHREMINQTFADFNLVPDISLDVMEPGQSLASLSSKLFVAVDKVLERVAGERIVCVKNVTGNEMVFLGHFPGYAIFPGVYITEALAQSAILLFKDEDTQDTDSLYLLYSTKMTFKSVVVPGDQMRMEIETQKATKLGIIVDAKAYVDDKVVAKGELIFSVKKSEDI